MNWLVQLRHHQLIDPDSQTDNYLLDDVKNSLWQFTNKLNWVLNLDYLTMNRNNIFDSSNYSRRQNDSFKTIWIRIPKNTPRPLDETHFNTALEAIKQWFWESPCYSKWCEWAIDLILCANNHRTRLWLLFMLYDLIKFTIDNYSNRFKNVEVNFNIIIWNDYKIVDDQLLTDNSYHLPSRQILLNLDTYSSWMLKWGRGYLESASAIILLINRIRNDWNSVLDKSDKTKYSTFIWYKLYTLLNDCIWKAIEYYWNQYLKSNE